MQFRDVFTADGLQHLGVSVEALKALGTASGTGGPVSGAMSLFDRPKINAWFHARPFYVKPLVLAGIAFVGGTLTGVVVLGQPLLAAAVSAVVGLAGAVAGPGWAKIRAEAIDELEEEISGKFPVAPRLVRPGEDTPTEPTGAPVKEESKP